MSRLFLGKPPANIEQWIMNKCDKTVYKVQTTSSYKKTGIYSAEQDDVSKPVKINWGDGTVETVDGDVSLKTHTYDSDGEFTVKVSNIKTFAASVSNFSWYNATSLNKYTLKELVNLSKAVTSIGNSAFAGCSGLTSVTIPNSVTSIVDWAFWRCSALTSVTIPDSVTSIGGSAFYDCSSLTYAVINGKTALSDQVFFNCPNLHEIWMPAYTVDEVVSHTIINDYGYSDWWIGFTNEKLVMVIIYCMDGTVVVNANDDSSGESSGS